MKHTLITLIARPILKPLLTGILFGLLSTVALQNWHFTRILDQQEQIYGETLAVLAARQAVDATVNQDLVSLQVILRDITANPRVANATIHDVENRLLVQAGSTPNLHRAEGAHNFSAPITFHDSVAGYVTLALKEQSYPVANNLTLALIVLLLGTLAIAFFKQQAQPVGSDTDAPVAGDDADADSARARIPIANLKPMADDLPANKHTVELALHIDNLHTLRRQLTGPLLKQLLEILERQIKGVCALYKGQLQENTGATPSRLTIFFRHSSQSSACFNALCTAYLLQRLTTTANNGIVLRLTAVITPKQEKMSLTEQMMVDNQQQSTGEQMAKRSARQIVLSSELAELDDMAQRIDCTAVEDEWHEMTGLQEPYSELLEKQLLQLKELHS